MYDTDTETRRPVRLLTGAAALAALQTDLLKLGTLHGWVYLMDLNFSLSLFADHLRHSQIKFIVDWKHRRPARDAIRTVPNFEAWHWSYNRTMHDKTLVFPNLDVIYLGTYNLTRGSYWLSLNRSVRIENRRLTQELMREWEEDKKRAVKITSATA